MTNRHYFLASWPAFKISKELTRQDLKFHCVDQSPHYFKILAGKKTASSSIRQFHIGILTITEAGGGPQRGDDFSSKPMMHYSGG